MASMRLVVIYLLLLVTVSVAAQDSILPAAAQYHYVRCLNMEQEELLLQKQDPTRKTRRDAALKMINDKLTEYRSFKHLDSVTEYTIPIVFHVVWNSATPAEKISLAQIKRQIEVINRDYNRLNSDTTKTPVPFQSVASSFHITFCLAQTDPNGNPTTGVVYKQTSETVFSYLNNAVKFPSAGGDTIWNPDKYLNIWVCNLGGSLLGYSEFPTNPLDNTFGSVILYKAIGDSGYLPLPAYNLGRTVSHEIGHLLNLHHPWGDDGGACPGSGGTDDGIADTPPEGNNKNDGYGDGTGPTYNGPPFPYMDNCSTTSPGIMFQNYMEYTNDSCMNLFTKDQYAVALAAIAGPLSKLVASNTCTAPNAIQEVLFNNSINIYPNPTSGKFNIQIGLTNFVHINLEVMNVMGQSITEWSSSKISNNTYSLDLSGQPNGLYFVRITDGTFSIVRKIMVSR
jgi:hypothetical protein